MYYSGKNTDQTPSTRKVVIGTSEVLRFLETALGEHIGAASQYLNLKSVMYQLVDNRINGNVMACCEVIKTQLLGYGIDKEELERIFDATYDYINRLFNVAIEYDISEYVCNFDLFGRGDTVIEILSERNSTVPINLADSARDYLEEAEENGDYVPERIRRALEELI